MLVDPQAHAHRAEPLLHRAVSTARLAAPARVVYSNVTAKPHDKDVESIKAKMCEQLMAGVLWEDTINDITKLKEIFFAPHMDVESSEQGGKVADRVEEPLI